MQARASTKISLADRPVDPDWLPGCPHRGVHLLELPYQGFILRRLAEPWLSAYTAYLPRHAESSCNQSCRLSENSDDCEALQVIAEATRQLHGPRPPIEVPPRPAGRIDNWTSFLESPKASQLGLDAGTIRG